MLSNWKRTLEEQIPINLVIKDEITQDEIVVLYNWLAKNKAVKSVDTLSPQKANIMMERHLSNNNHSIDELLGYNPFPFVIQVFLKSTDDTLLVQNFLKDVKQKPQIQEISTLEKTENENIFQLVSKLLRVGLWIGLFLFVISVILLINYIKISLLRKKASFFMLKRQKKTLRFILKPLITKISIFLVGGFSLAIIFFGFFMQSLHKIDIKEVQYFIDMKTMAQVISVLFIVNLLIGTLITYLLLRGMLLPFSQKKQ